LAYAQTSGAPPPGNANSKTNGTLSGTGPAPYGSGGAQQSAPAAGYTASQKVPYSDKSTGRSNPPDTTMPPKGESAGPPTAAPKKHGKRHHRVPAAATSTK
jgi:hypothetical protein